MGSSFSHVHFSQSLCLVRSTGTFEQTIKVSIAGLVSHMEPATGARLSTPKLVWFLRGHVKRHSPKIHLLVGVDAGHDEEETGSFGTAGAQTTEPEHHSSFVLLDHLEEKNEMRDVETMMNAGNSYKPIQCFAFSNGTK